MGPRPFSLLKGYVLLGGKNPPLHAEIWSQACFSCSTAWNWRSFFLTGRDSPENAKYMLKKPVIYCPPSCAQIHMQIMFIEVEINLHSNRRASCLSRPEGKPLGILASWDQPQAKWREERIQPVKKKKDGEELRLTQGANLDTALRSLHDKYGYSKSSRSLCRPANPLVFILPLFWTWNSLLKNTEAEGRTWIQSP